MPSIYYRTGQPIGAHRQHNLCLSINLTICAGTVATEGEEGRRRKTQTSTRAGHVEAHSSLYGDHTQPANTPLRTPAFLPLTLTWACAHWRSNVRGQEKNRVDGSKTQPTSCRQAPGRRASLQPHGRRKGRSRTPHLRIPPPHHPSPARQSNAASRYLRAAGKACWTWRNA